MIQPSLSTYEDHVDVTPSASNGNKKGKIRFPCRLCEGEHLVHLCPLMDKASIVLENLTAPQPHLPIGYQKLSSDPLQIGKEIAFDSSLAHPALAKPDCVMSVPDQPLVEKSVDLVSPLVVHSVSEEHNDNIAHVLLVSSNSPE